MLAAVLLASVESLLLGATLGALSAVIACNYHGYDYDCKIQKEKIVCTTTSPFGRIRNIVFNSPISEVTIQTEILRYFGEGHMVVLALEDGYEVPLTPICTMEPKR